LFQSVENQVSAVAPSRWPPSARWGCASAVLALGAVTFGALLVVRGLSRGRAEDGRES
jgi:hypothetical protein